MSGVRQFETSKRGTGIRTGVVEVGLVASDDVSWVGRHVDVCGERFSGGWLEVWCESWEDV